MKYCVKCEKNFSDNHFFCPDCGSKLNDFAVDASGANNAGRLSQNSNSGFASWLPVIFAAVGALIGWFFSGLLGFVLGGVGVSMAIQQKKQGQMKWLPFLWTWILAVIDMIFWVIAMAA